MLNKKSFMLYFCIAMLFASAYFSVNPVFAQETSENSTSDSTQEAYEKELEKNPTSDKLGDYIIVIDQEKYGDLNEVESRITIYDESSNIIPESVRMHYVLTNLSPNLAKASGYYACFSKVEWIKRNGIWSLSVYPKYSVGGYTKEQAFNFLKASHVNNSQWAGKNVSSMHNQFVCHYDIAGPFKTPWNLEPSTPDKGYWGFVASGCN